MALINSDFNKVLFNGGLIHIQNSISDTSVIFQKYAQLNSCVQLACSQSVRIRDG